MFSITLVLVVSVAVQIAAAVLALSLIRITGKKLSWILISIAILLMSVRRLIPLYHIILQEMYPIDFLNEIIGLVLSVFMLLGVIGIKSIFIERNIHRKKVLDLLTEKDVLLKEVHHRIKNNMNTVRSLLSIQASGIDDENTATILNDAGNRIKTMAVLYDKLYVNMGFDDISIKEYLSELSKEIIYNTENLQKIKLEESYQDFTLDAKRLQPLGIIVNELITNSVKYAFQETSNPVISITTSLTDNIVKITIGDNGKGLSSDIDFENSPGFGLNLVNGLCMQIDAKIEIERNKGTVFYIKFNLK